MENAPKTNPVPADENLENEPTDEQLLELMRRVATVEAEKARARRERFVKELRECILRAAKEE